MKPIRTARSERGVTLIELLISVAIGFVVVAAVIVSFVDSGKAGKYQTALSQMSQDAQVALNLLSREIQLAGYVSPANSLGASVYPIFGCDGAKGAVPFNDPAVTGLPTCNASGASTVSALEVVYEADLKTTVPAGVTPTPSDCLGNALPAAGAIYIARNRYFVDTSAGGRPELYCASNASAKQPLLENVDDMQIWYGVVASAAPTQIVRYAKAGKDATTANTVNAQGAGEWDNVMSVRLCLLMRSAEPILTPEDKQTYLDCNSTSVTYTDRYLRRAYFTTAAVRIKMG